MNITDVGHLQSDADTGEDKMLMGAKREGKTVYERADFYTKEFFSDTEKLNIKRTQTPFKIPFNNGEEKTDRQFLYNKKNIRDK